jgi:hypothetical protein
MLLSCGILEPTDYLWYSELVGRSLWYHGTGEKEGLVENYEFHAESLVVFSYWYSTDTQSTGSHTLNKYELVSDLKYKGSIYNVGIRQGYSTFDACMKLYNGIAPVISYCALITFTIAPHPKDNLVRYSMWTGSDLGEPESIWREELQVPMYRIINGEKYYVIERGKTK